MNKVFTLTRYVCLSALVMINTKVVSQDFNVQQVQTDVSNSGSAGSSGFAESTSTSFTAVSSLTSAFVLPSNNRKTHAGRSDSSNTSLEGDDMSGAVVLTGTGTLTYYRETASISDAMNFQTNIWEYTGTPGGANEFIVRGRYTASLPNGGTGLGYTYQDIDLTSAGISDPNKVVPFITGIMNDDSTNGSDSGTAIAHLTSSTNLIVRKGTSSNNVTVFITLVEFTGSNWTVLHGNTTSTANTGSITLYDGYDATGTATDVTSWANAIIFTQSKAQTAATGGEKEKIRSQWPLMAPGSDTQTVDWSFDSTRDPTGNSNRHFIHVIDNPNITVTRFTDTSYADNETTIDISSASLADINQAMVVGSMITAGNGNGYGQGWRNYYLNSTTQAAHWCHRSGNAGGVSHNIQIIDFNYVPTQTDGPGGVTANLELWLKANEGVEEAASDAAENNDAVLNWLDNTINTNDATQSTPANKPTYTTNALNFNPVIDFDGDDLIATSAIASNSDMTVFAVAEGQSGTDKQIINLNGGDNIIIEFEDNTPTFRARMYDGTNTGEISTTTISNGDYFIANYDLYSSSNSELFIDGVSISTDATNAYAPTSPIANVGRHPSNSAKRWDGGIAEMIVYTGSITNTERDKIESYLALKYGFTLGVNGTSQDYVASDDTVIWDQSVHTGYNYNVTGVGRDDGSSLIQKQSKSINTNDDITVGIEEIANTNEENTAEFFGDTTFLMWGHNNGSTAAGTDITKDFSSGITGQTNSVSATPINRIWKMVVTDSVPSVKISIPESMVSSTNPGSEDYIMIIADDASFSTNVTSATMEDVGSDLEVDFYFEGTKFITFGSAPETAITNGAAVTFDRGDKYLSAGNVNDLANSDYTISAWVKRDPGNGKFDVVSKRNYYNENTDLEPGPDYDGNYTHGYAFRINKDNKFRMVWRDPEDTQNQILETNETIPEDEWHHIAASYDFSANMAILYIDGIHVYDSDDYLADKGEAHKPMNTPSDAHFMIGAAHHIKRQQRLGGSVDEVRVWDVPLSGDQIRYIMNQEIEENGDFNADGKVLPSATTKNEIVSIPWNNLIAYYPMSTMVFGSIKDESNSGNDASMIQYDLLDEQTAPLPYVSTQDGDWDDPNTWENGDVQYLPGVVSYLYENEPLDTDKITMDYNIVRIEDDVTMDNTDTSLIPAYKNDNRTVLGLVVNSGTLKIDGSNTGTPFGNAVTISHYLRVDGKIDLAGESQLIQTTDSDLDEASSGTLERDQQGTADLYTYNYWSSPVGFSNTTTNNNSYTLPDILNDGSDEDNPDTITYVTTGYDGTNSTPIGIADYWIWKFANQLDDDYSAWQHVRSTGSISAGEGFTMKGPGTGGISDDQNYAFNGKPNNGTINLTISVGNDYLVGNPYPSAIDADQFITDNASSISGTLYFWEHWGGGTHVLSAYQGGYGLYNLSGGAPASGPDPDVAQVGVGTKTPGQYIPVSQGFFVVASGTGGTISFNNGQRIFQQEGSASSVFMKPDEINGDRDRNAEADEVIASDTRKKIRLGLNSVNTYHRQLLLTADVNATADYDFGYDGMLHEDQLDDLYWLIDNDKYVIQGVTDFQPETVLPLGIHTENDGLNSITIDALENMPDDIGIYLHDKQLNIFHSLQESDYDFYMDAGEYLERFEITFKRNQLDIDEFDFDNINVHYSNNKERIIVINPTYKEIKSIVMYNILGQKIQHHDVIPTEDYIELRTPDLSSGSYIIKLNTMNGTFSKKVLVE